MEKQLIRACETCGHGIGAILYSARFILLEGNPLVDHYDIVTCYQCGFAFADTASPQADYDRYYNLHSKYEDAATSTGSALSSGDRKRIRLSAAHIAALIPDKNTAIADIGCANGGLLGALHELGYYHLTGIDPSPNCARTTDARPGITGIAGTFFNLPTFARPFDAILFTGVLEHVRDIRKAIRGLDTILVENGYLYIAVPDAARYHELPDAPFQEFNVEHVNHFTQASLQNFMESCGYRVVAIEQLAFDVELGHDSLAVLGLFQRLPEESPLQIMVHDESARENLALYIAISQTTMDDLVRQLAHIFTTHSSLILWGTGQLALKLLTLPEVNHAKIKAFVDGNPINQGEVLLGKTILAPSQITAMKEPIVIMTTLHHTAIVRVIREELQMQNPIFTLYTAG